MKILQRISLFIAAITATVAISGASLSVQAQVFNNAKRDACRGASFDNSTANCDSNAAAGRIEKTISAVINVISIIVGIVAVILIIINGLRFITANGDSNGISSARNGIIYAVVGLIVAALAQVIVRFVLGRF